MAIAAPPRALPITRVTTMLERALGTLQGALRLGDPEAAGGAAAMAIATLLAQIESAAAAGKAAYAQRVETTGAATTKGFRDTAAWLSQTAGTSPTKAKDQLAAQASLAGVEGAGEALFSGLISPEKAREIAKVADLDPRAARSLLGRAATSTLADVKDRAARMKRQARGEGAIEADEARAHNARFARISPDGRGGMRLEALFTKAVGAKVKSALAQMQEVLFQRLPQGERADYDHLAADALFQLVCGGGSPTKGAGPEVLATCGPPAHVLLRLDATALRRGHLEGDELCEIDGVGPVSLRLARQLLGDALLTVVLATGKDIHTVSKTTRTITARLRAALEIRDRTCCVPGCDTSHFLEIHHWKLEYALNGRTELANLARLCSRHHSMATNTGWRLTRGHPDWGWVGPGSDVRPMRRRT